MDSSRLDACSQVGLQLDSPTVGGKKGWVSAGVPGCAAGTPGGTAETPLGIHAGNASPPLAESGLVRRYALQRMARELLPGERRLHGCVRWMQQSATVQLLHVPRHQVGAYRGLQHCGQVWACPVCSAKISERRRQELALGIEQWQGGGQKVLLVTYTIQHKRAHSLKSTLEGLLKARKGLLSGEAAKRFNRRHGVAGRVRALEVTHGKNGWHPHIHELIFVTGDTNRAELVTDLRRKWAARIEASCGRTVNDYGVHVQFADMNVADYVAKFGYERTWGPEHELTKSASKIGKLKNRGPIGLLSDAFCGDEKAARLWAEYALTFKGKRQLSWSDGLRELLGLCAEKTDEEVAGELREEAVWMDELSKDEWRCVLGNDARAELLNVLGRGSIAELRETLNIWGIVRTDRESEEEPDAEYPSAPHPNTDVGAVDGHRECIEHGGTAIPGQASVQREERGRRRSERRETSRGSQQDVVNEDPGSHSRLRHPVGRTRAIEFLDDQGDLGTRDGPE